MRLTAAMSNQNLSYPISPRLLVTKSEVALTKIRLPVWRDPFAACLYFDFHHRDPKTFERGLREMQNAQMSCPNKLLSKTGLYQAIQRPGGVRRPAAESIMHEHRHQPVGNFISQMANRARFENKIPLTHRELRKDLSGNRRTVL